MRLTDAQLEAIHGRGVDIEPDTCEIGLDELRALTSELRERRSFDLTYFDMIVLSVLLKRIDSDPLTDRAAIVVIERVIAAASHD